MARVSSSHVSDLEQGDVDTAPASDHRPHRSSFTAILVSLRPEQWTKNLVVFAGLLFGGRLIDPSRPSFRDRNVRDLLCLVWRGLSLQRRGRSRRRPGSNPLKRARTIASGQRPRAPLYWPPDSSARWGRRIARGALWSGWPPVATCSFSAVLGRSQEHRHHRCAHHRGGFGPSGGGGRAGGLGADHQCCSSARRCWPFFSHSASGGMNSPSSRRGNRSPPRILEEYTPYLLDRCVGRDRVDADCVCVYATSTRNRRAAGTTRLGLTIPFVLYGIFRYSICAPKRGGGSPTACS